MLINFKLEAHGKSKFNSKTLIITICIFHICFRFMDNPMIVFDILWVLPVFSYNISPF